MPRSPGAWLVVAVALVLVMAGATLANGLDVSLEYQGSAKLAGSELNPGAEVLVSESGSQSTPLTLTPDEVNGLRYGLGYTFGLTRFGLSWLRLEDDASAQGSTPGYYADLAGVTNPWSNRFNQTAFSYGFPGFWGIDENFFRARGPFGWYEDAYYYLPSTCWPTQLVRTEAAWDPDRGALTWSASGDSSMGSLYGTVERTVLSSESGKLTLIGGFHRLDWSQGLEQSLAAVRHEDISDITLRYGANPLSFTEADYAKRVRTVWDNRLWIDSTESVSYRPAGLAIGAAGSWSLTDRLSLTGSYLQSYLSGKAEYSGTVTEVDERSYQVTQTVYGSPGPVETVLADSYSRAENAFALDETESKHKTRATEAHAGLEFKLTERLFATLGYAWSRWNDLPAAPQWYYTSGNAGEWRFDGTTDLEYTRWTVGLGVRF